MSQFNSISLTQTDIDERTFISQVYLWMTAALVITAIVAAWTAWLQAEARLGPLAGVCSIGRSTNTSLSRL